MIWDLYNRVMILLLILQAVTTGFLILIAFQSVLAENTFAIFLAIDLVAFAISSYMFRAEKNNELPRRPWIILGTAVIGGLFLSSIILH